MVHFSRDKKKTTFILPWFIYISFLLGLGLGYRHESPFPDVSMARITQFKSKHRGFGFLLHSMAGTSRNEVGFYV